MGKEGKGKYIFSLFGINIEKVDQKYGLDSFTSTADDEYIPENTTKIDDLELVRKNFESFTFLDETKKIRKCMISMIDYQSGNQLEHKNNYKCFWDKNYLPERIQPIGCPIKYIPSKAIKTYYSEISKENYTISENITPKRAQNLEEKDEKIKIINNNYYQVDGIFCSANCCLAYIEDNKTNPLYRHSTILLYQLQRDLTGESDNEIIPAPHWRLLEEFGGNLTINKFRESFNRIRYIDHGRFFAPIGKIYEDQIKF
jgi:hypothetical protein